MANELPTNVGYGTVTGRFLIAYADGSDLDLYPDGVPAKGNIYFTPVVEKLRNSSASPAPVTIIPQQVTCTIDADGYLNGPQGAPGVRLIATDDADNDPTGWTYTVQYQLTDQSDTPLRGVTSHSMAVPAGTTIDLTSVAPVAGLVI